MVVARADMGLAGPLSHLDLLGGLQGCGPDLKVLERYRALVSRPN